MCGRFVQCSDPEVYGARFDLDAICEATPRYNVAPTQPVLAIRADRRKRELTPCAGAWYRPGRRGRTAATA